MAEKKKPTAEKKSWRSGYETPKKIVAPGRKAGGRVGADSTPLSQAAKNTGGRRC